jgi:hypothetical protein
MIKVLVLVMATPPALFNQQELLLSAVGKTAAFRDEQGCLFVSDADIPAAPFRNGGRAAELDGLGRKELAKCTTQGQF